MAYRQIYPRQNGAYLPVRNLCKGSVYYNPFSLKVHINDHVFNHDQFPDEYADTLSCGDYL